MKLVATIFFGLLNCICASGAVQVTVTEGTLQGSVLQTVALDVTYHSYKGIPYAKPPVGNLRFMPPQAPESWTGVRNATEHGSVCPQFDIFQLIYINGSEDCLFLNVYTPIPNDTYLYPVVFFIHGGGYKSGSGDSSNYGPDFFIEKGVIVVTINYRLGAFGFLSLENEMVPGNMGMKDQVAALKWVNLNIDKFGGDPKNITIMGQSAGGSSVVLHLISPMSKNLFRRAIPMSGTPNAEFSVTYQPRMRAFKLGSILGLETSNDTELLEFLQSVPPMDIVKTNVTLLGTEVLSIKNIFKFLEFVPVIEPDFGTEQFLVVDPLEAFSNGDIHDVDVMFGMTSGEAVTAVPLFISSVINTTSSFPETLVPKKIIYNCTPDTAMEISKLIKQHYFNNDSISVGNIKEFVNFTTESYLTVAIQRMFNLLPTSRSHYVYSYVLSTFSSRNYYGSRGIPYGLYETAHMDDTLYLFNVDFLELTSDVYELVDLISTIFTNFIKHGNPTPDSSLNITWPEFDSTNKSYINIGNNTLTIGNNYLNNSLNFYEKVFRKAGIRF